MRRIQKRLLVVLAVLCLGGPAVVDACHRDPMPRTPPVEKTPDEVDVDVKIDPVVEKAMARVEAISAREIDAAVEAAIARAKSRIK
jgi:hypothetical protein